MEQFTGRVYAKVNLSLAITGKRENLHTLDMIVCPYRELYDEAVFKPDNDATELTVGDIKSTFSAFKPTRFLDFFIRKLQIISKKFGVFGTVDIVKNVPLGAGLGGSSASVAAVVKAVREYLISIGKEDEIDNEFLLSLGSDVPCMFMNGVCRVQGVGEIITPLSCDIPEDLTVEIADGGSDTAMCYAEYDRRNEFQDGQIAVDVETAITNPRNDLTKAAIAFNPNIGILLEEMKGKYSFVIMSGSGSAVLGAYKYQ